MKNDTPTREQLESWIKKWENNIKFITLRIAQQNATKVTGRKYFPYEIEEEQLKIDNIKIKFKQILN